MVDRLPVPVPDQTERSRALDITLSCVVEAPAGSGKTGLLIQRYLKLLTTVDDPSEVLALTFTRKAAGEMRARILKALRAAKTGSLDGNSAFEKETHTLALAVLQRDDERSWQLMQRPHLLNIRTFDALCSTIAHAVPLLSGSAALAAPVEDTEPLYRRAAHAVMMRLGGEDARLNRAIELVLRHRDGDLRNCETVLSEMLGTREQWGRLVPLGAELDDATLETVVLPRLNQTLERAQCAALKRLHACFPEHALSRVACLAWEFAAAAGYKDQPNEYAACAQLGSSPGHAVGDLDHWLLLAHTLLTKGGTWRQRVWQSELRVSVGKEQAEELRDILAGLQDMLHSDELLSLLHAVRRLPPARYPADQWEVAKALFRLLQQALVELRLLFARENACDFTEVALAARTALESGELQVSMGTRLRHLLVDEMQDSSSSQYDLLETLTEGWDGTTQTIFLVGDPKQSIYLFRQARVERFQRCIAEGSLGGVALLPLRLSANFRSRQPLVQDFNEVFEQVFPANGGTGDVTFTTARAVLPGSAADGIVWHGTLLQVPADPVAKFRERHAALRNEAEAIAAIVKHEKATRPDARIAVLTRVRNHVVEIAKVFAEREIPYRAVNIDALHERREVLDILAITRALLHPADRTAWLAVMRAPWCGAGLADLHALAGGDQREQRTKALRILMRTNIGLLPSAMRERVTRTLDVLDASLLHTGVEPVAQRVERTWRSLGGDACVDALGLENVRQFLRVLDSMDEKGEAISLHSLQRRLERLFAQPGTTPGAVDIMTIHKAKGLEWDVVLVPGLHQRGAHDRLTALNWLELPGQAVDGSQDVLLAPLPEKGEATGTLYSFVQGIRTQRERAELKRLFYVAATRAKRELHLFAAPVAGKQGAPTIHEGTLLKAAGDAAAAGFAFALDSIHPDGSVVEDPEAVLSLAAEARDATQAAQKYRPVLERLDAGYDPLSILQTASINLHLRAEEVWQPSSQHRPQGSFGARAVGNAIHGFVERLAEELRKKMLKGPEFISASHQVLLTLPSWTPAIRAALRSGGLPPDEVQRATRTVLLALSNLLKSAEGRWVLMPHLEAESEAAWRYADGNTVRSVRLDRSFFAGPRPLAPGGDTLWIVDFKTADRAPREQDAFLRQEQVTYRDQLEEYGRLRASTLPSGTPVMLALSYPLMQRLLFWPLHSQEVTLLPPAEPLNEAPGPAGASQMLQQTLF